MAHGRRRRRRRSTSPSAGAPPAGGAEASTSGSRQPAATPSPPAPPPSGSGPQRPDPQQRPSQRRPDAPTAQESPAADTGEQVWERTHLEQMMFALARDQGEAAARCARAAPPDRSGEQTHSLISILMSFLALEAFINMAGGDRLGRRYRHYDRMSLEGKWLEVTRLVTKEKKTFDEDGEELRGLATLRNWRNMLTHYKGAYEEVQSAGRGGETSVGALLSHENAARALETARALYRAFYTWDRRSPPRQFIWLDDRPHRPKAAAEAPPPVAASSSVAGAARTASTGEASRRRRRRRR